ncbi:dynein axonemal assembly factor 4-like [Epargyreus clarus]|uniref:dynein axonemal assembly factor 4-like n=1 Tax=Epargyreus clarus TaxID=520877 RepID=UPI003C2DAA49
MPILIKDFTWSQTPEKLHIRIPVNPVFRENVDLFTSDCYIKANFTPFLFEVFLLHEINNDTSKCTITDDLIVLDLIKKQELDWKSLEKSLTKEEKMKIRQKIIEQSQEKAKKEAEERVIKKSQLDRFTVQQAMDIDNKQHILIDSRRDAHRKKAMGDLEQWRQSVTKPSREVTLKTEEKDFQKGVKITELPPSDDEIDKNSKERDETQAKKDIAPTNKINEVTHPTVKLVKSQYVEKKKREAAKRVLPKLRESSVLEIKHTPRTFPTPSRESKAEEEEAWLKNITFARRATGFVSEDLRPEEQDPQWCKEKGDEFFRSGNFLGAISAYTHGITLSDKLPSLYANRAATHFALGNFNKCVNDCSTALDLMKPACEGNRRSRAKCIARRGAALARLGYLSKGIGEMKAAAKLLPEDENIKKDVYDMERAWEQNPDSD